MSEADYDISVSTDFDGANPQTADGVMREGAASFIIVPTQEEDNPNYKFRMDTLIVNRAREPRKVRLEVDWRTPTYMDVRHHLFLSSGKGWERVAGTLSDTFCTVTAEVPPGETWACLNPKYSYTDHLADLERLRPRSGVEVTSIGKSAQDRDVFAISVAPKAGKDPRPVVLIEAGNHPYETSGAYCINGMLAWLLGPGKEWQSRIAAHFIQVSNPDGVAGGWCRLTGPGGVDVCHEMGVSSDPTCVALRTFLEEVRPAIYVNIHGWMYNELDNFRYGDRETAPFFFPALLGDTGGEVLPWRVQNSPPEDPPVTNTWYARAHLGSRSMGFDIAWNRHSEDYMRTIGAAILEGAGQAAVSLRA